MIIMWEHGHIGSHVVHHDRKQLEKGIDRLAAEMSEVLVLSPVCHVHSSLNLSIPSMSILQLLPNPTSQVLYLNPIEFRLAQSTKQVVDRLVVGVEHIPRSWRKEVNRVNISCVHCNVPKDLSLATEERSHPSLPHLLILPLEVRRTQSPFLVHHFWILDWLESQKTRTGFDTN
jgi:hypothetical protein